MSFQVSPGINVSEVDLTAGVQAVSVSAGGFAGSFQWGPALDVRNVSSEEDLVRQFGKPDGNTYEHWFTAQSFLAYSNQLKVVRAIANNALNATCEAKTLTGTVANSSATTLTGTGTSFTTELVVGQSIVLAGSVSATVNSITNATSLTLTSALSNAVTAAAITSYGTLIKNEAQHDASYASGASGHGFVASKWPGDLGNSLKVSMCPSATAFLDEAVAGTLTLTAGSAVASGSGTDFVVDLIVGDYLVANGHEYRISSITNTTSAVLETEAEESVSLTTANWSRKWEYADIFDGAPGTSAFADDRTCVTDEMHIVIIDENGLFTGIPGTVLEKYAFVSKASDAKTLNGDTNYYKDILNRTSSYVWWMAHVGTTTNWGSAAAQLTYGAKILPYSYSLRGANDANESITAGNIQTAYDLFLDTDNYDIALLMAGPSTMATSEYLVSSIAEVRKDCVVFVSPLKASVVNNTDSEVDDITTDRASLPSSSYAFMDSGWKWTYDKYNDAYRWVPLNGDIAGIAARADATNDPWFSPAGFTRGNIKNVVKLAWTPKQSDRDDLYKIGVNPVVSFAGQGVLLYGDKTLLSRPSAFDRINVRRLFITLEKQIARYAKTQLFEFNDEYTRSAFRNVVEPFLRDVKARRGIEDFLVVCDSTNNPPSVVNQNQFVGSIYVKPTRSINFIQLNFVAVRSGVSFQEVVGTAN